MTSHFNFIIETFYIMSGLCWMVLTIVILIVVNLLEMYTCSQLYCHIWSVPFNPIMEWTNIVDSPSSTAFRHMQQINMNSNSNSIFIAPNLYPKTDSRRTKQKQKTVIINLRHSKGQRHGEK